MRALLLSALCLAAASAGAQTAPAPPPADAPPVLQAPRGPLRLSGPRIGFTVLSDELVDQINDVYDNGGTYNPDTGQYEEEDPRISSAVPVITQFGWQWERSLFQAASGLTGVTEWVLLVGGMERGLLLPSATFLVGVRGPGGLEFGIGPNVSVGGAAYAVTAGFNTDLGEVSLPVNVAAVLGQDGPRLSVLVGLVVSDRRY